MTQQNTETKTYLQTYSIPSYLTVSAVAFMCAWLVRDAGLDDARLLTTFIFANVFWLTAFPYIYNYFIERVKTCPFTGCDIENMRNDSHITALLLIPIALLTCLAMVMINHVLPLITYYCFSLVSLLLLNRQYFKGTARFDLRYLLEDRVTVTAAYTEKKLECVLKTSKPLEADGQVTVNDFNTVHSGEAEIEATILNEKSKERINKMLSLKNPLSAFLRRVAKDRPNELKDIKADLKKSSDVYLTEVKVKANPEDNKVEIMVEISSKSGLLLCFTENNQSARLFAEAMGWTVKKLFK